MTLLQGDFEEELRHTDINAIDCPSVGDSYVYGESPSSGSVPIILEVLKRTGDASIPGRET